MLRIVMRNENDRMNILTALVRQILMVVTV